MLQQRSYVQEKKGTSTYGFMEKEIPEVGENFEFFVRQSVRFGSRVGRCALRTVIINIV